MTRREDDHPYVSETNYLEDARPGPMQRRVCAFFITLTFILFCLYALTGCYGTAIDTRSITADEVTISQNTPWSNLTITAKGWKSDVRGQPANRTDGAHKAGEPPSAAGAAPGAVPALESASPAADPPSSH